MESPMILVAIIVLVALAFDFINGFHDAANSIATVVATRVLTPYQAVLWAATFNFLAAFVIGTGVAKTVGSGMIDLQYVTPYVILGGLIGAIAWDLITWWFGLPTSSSHALIGGYAGAAMARVAHLRGLDRIFDAIIWSAWIKTTTTNPSSNASTPRAWPSRPTPSKPLFGTPKPRKWAMPPPKPVWATNTPPA